MNRMDEKEARMARRRDRVESEREQIKDERRKTLEVVAGRILGQITFYLVMRKLGAPRYVAYFAATTNAQLVELRDPIAEQARKVF